MLQWSLLLAIPGCAVASALVVGVIHRNDELDDGALLRRFIAIVFIGNVLLYATVQRPSVQLRLHPELQLQADIEADPIYQGLAHVGPEYASQFLAVLVAERATSATLPQSRLQARPLLYAIATNRLGFASQVTRIAWGQATVDALRELRARSPEECYAALSGQALDRETLAHGFSAQNTAAFDAAAVQVLLDSPGIETRGKGGRRERFTADQPVDFNATMAEYQGIQNEVAQGFGPDVATLLTSKRFPQTVPMAADTLCAARIHQLDAILQRPQAQAALMIDTALR
jgi:hypothetical protein